MEQKKQPIPLKKWIWRSFLRTALLPLIIVELAFIGIYFFTNEWSKQVTVDLLKEETQKELAYIADRESQVIYNQLHIVENTTRLYQTEVLQALNSDAQADSEDRSRLAFSEDGAYYTTADRADGGAAVFYSGYVPVDDSGIEKTERVLQTQQFMENVVNNQPLIAAVYYNSNDSLNVIYPYFNVLEQYAPKMDIPSYNFYYEADAEHNPEREAVWTDAYLDPAGNGWMTSSIAPVYNGDTLEGVVGIDVTIDTITSSVLNMDLPWNGYGVLVGKDGTILALPEVGEGDWGLNEMTDHTYSEAILGDTFKPEEFNIYSMENLGSLSSGVESKDSGMLVTDLNDETNYVAWTTIPEIGWKFFVVVDQDDIFASVNDASSQLFTIGTYMIAGLVFFYLIFFSILYRNSRSMSQSIANPLLTINTMAQRIGQGEYDQRAPNFNVSELNETADELVHMGQNLGTTNAHLAIAQQELTQKEADLRALVHSIDDIVIEIDREGVYHKVWSRNEALLPLPLTKMVGRSMAQFLDEDAAASLASLLEDLYETGETKIIDYPLHTSVGEKWFQLRFAPIKQEQDDHTFELVALTLRDITERVEMEENLVLAKNEAEKASAAKSEFLSSMSHELRTPLNAILGFAQLLEFDEDLLDESQKESVDEILKAGNHLLYLINEVLDLARIESGHLSVTTEAVEPGRIIDEIVKLTKPLAESHGIIMNAQHVQTSHVLADYTRLKQVLLNLVSNAIKYNVPSGSIWIDVAETDSHVTFSIKDTGKGIDSRHFKQIFEPFQRINEDATNVEGTGIGLTVSKQLVELMGSHIHVESEVGKGSTFSFSLQRTDAVHSEETDKDGYDFTSLDEVAATNERHVLYVEDHAANRQLIDSILKTEPGITLETAVNGEEGIEKLSTQSFDLLLLDLNLPGINGYDVLNYVRARKEFAHMPVIAISANAMPEDIQKGKQAGFDDYLTKPIDINHFRETISRFLP